jgi:hypothetical protein
LLAGIIVFPFLLKFPVGETVEVPTEAVSHIFGHGRVDKVPYMVQLALIQTTNDIPKGLKILEKFEIHDRPQWG